jgi:hypothetical protein
MALISDLTLDSRRLKGVKIEPTFAPHEATPRCFLHAIQEIVEAILPETVISELESQSAQTRDSALFQFYRSLPLVHYPPFTDAPNEMFPITFLLPGEYTHGSGRYVTDMLSRWLYPGKQLCIAGKIELNFRFSHFQSPSFFLTQELISIAQDDELDVVRKNLPLIVEEIKTNIRAVYHARYVASLKSASEEERARIINENLSFSFSQEGDLNLTLYDQVQTLLRNHNGEKRIDEVKKNISYLAASRLKIFDSNLFYEMTQFSSLFNRSLSSGGNPRHLCRVMAYLYLFKKWLLERIGKESDKRHVTLRAMSVGKSIAVVFGFNFLKETERFDVKHLLSAVRNILPEAEFVDSVVADRRDEKIRLFYFEIASSSHSRSDFRSLREKLPQEILRQIETPVPPLFMPRNDEEVMRTLIVLNKQIRYLRDLPQVSIHYEMQSESELTFIVVLVRLLKKSSSPLERLLESFSSPLKFETEEIRIAGYLKNRVPKEAAILRTSLDKKPFFRPDHSIDVLRARQRVASELASLLGEFRDFNGGIILKQEEALSELRSALGPLSQSKELLLENYFYSLKPGIMQTVYDSATLKRHFQMLLEGVAFPPHSETHRIFHDRQGKYSLCFIKAIAPSIKETVLDDLSQLQIPSHDLSTVYLKVDQAYFLGMILRAETQELIHAFEKCVSESLSRWSQSFSCSVNGDCPLDVVE